MLYLYCLLLLIYNPLIFSKAEISDLRKCADPLCKVKISEGRTTQRYFPKEKGVLGCKSDDIVTVYSKEAGINKHLWGVEINGKRGYFPAKFIKEEKVYMKNLSHLVPMPSLHSETNADDKVDIPESVMDDGPFSTSEKESIHEEVPLDSVLLSPEDAEFDSINSFVSEETSPSVAEEASPSAADSKVEESKEEIKITVTKSGDQANIVQKTIKSEAEGQVVESANTNEEKVVVDNQGAESTKAEDNIKRVHSKIELEEKSEIGESRNEKINLEIKTDESKNEEMDNDEGNGNEGEDNGSEYVLEDSSNKGEIKDFTVGEEKKDVVENEIESLVAKESLNIENQSGGTVDTKKAGMASSAPAGESTKVGNDSPSSEQDKLTSEIDAKFPESSMNKIAHSKPELAPSSPLQYQMVDGTAIPVEDSEFYQSSPNLELSNTHTLEASSKLSDSPNTEKTAPISKLPGIPLTEPPLLLKNKLKEMRGMEPVPQIKSKLSSESSIDPVVNLKSPEVKADEIASVDNQVTSTSVNDEKTSLTDDAAAESSEETSLEGKVDTVHSNPDIDDAEFSSPKLETILDSPSQSEDDEKSQIENFDASQSQIESTVGQGSEIESTDRLERFVSTESPESWVEPMDSYESPTESTVISNDQIERSESSMKFIDIPENTDESETPVEDDGLLSSLTNPFSFLERDNEDNIHEKDNQYLETEPPEDSVKQQETTSDSQDSDLLVENIPFIDPEINSLKNEEDSDTAVDKELEDGSSQSESKGHILTDEAEESDVHSFQKKLLHASESVYQWMVYPWKMNEGMVLALEGELADPHLSTGTVTFLLVVAGTIVVLYLSHMIIVKMSRESPLLEMMNVLDRNQRVLTEENNNLKRQLTDKNGQIKSAACADPAILRRLREQLESDKQKFVEEMEELRERNQQLETDLEASTANEVELHRMLDELLSNQQETTNFEDSVNSLQLMLDSQREIVEDLTSDLALKTRLNEELRNELKSNKSKVSKLEYQIEQLTKSLEEVNTTKHELMKRFSEEEENSRSLKEMNDILRQEVDKTSKDSQNSYKETQKLLQEVRKLKQKVHNKEAECRISKECLKRLQILADGGGNDIHGKLAEIFKIIEVKTQLASVQQDRDSMHTRLEENRMLIFSQTEDLKSIQYENSHLRETSSTLQKERDDAVSKLEVLSKYYEEKEAQLKKTLESQEGLLQSAEGSATVVSNRIHTYELELESCRSQIESLMAELEEQKQSYKVQLANEEKKLHDTWLTARAAERRQEELRQENTQLRQSLTHMQRDSDHKNMFNKPPPKRVDANGSVSSPIPMENDVASLHPGMPPLALNGTLPPLPHPPPMMFPGRPPLHPPHPGLPPLPPHLFGPLPPPPPMPDRRLPPAGRIASPPGYDRRSYSPESDRSRYSDHRYSPGPPRYSPNNHRGHSPDRRADHIRRNIPLRRNQRSPSPNLRRNQRSPSPLDSRQRHSPRERWYNHSPPGLSKNHRSPPLDYYDSPHENRISSGKRKKTSTPLGPNDR